MFLVSCWDDIFGKREKISQPDTPTGDSFADIGELKTYRTGGAVSSRGHSVVYRFDLDATGSHRYTAWGPADSVTVSWPDSGLYVVKAQARCAIHQIARSSWSEGKYVVVGDAELEPPEIFFATRIEGVQKPYVHDPVPKDTVAMFAPFEISYHGISVNGPIVAYKFFPLTTGVELPGANEWTTDITDTLRTFPNTRDDPIPSGVFKLAAQCRDAVGEESLIDVAIPNERGVCQVVVNFDPETQLLDVSNTYHTTGGMVDEDIDFNDGIPDTIPYRSFVRIRYWGRDDDRDGKLECNDLEPDKCIGFQVAYRSYSPYNPGANEFSLWRPRDGVHDTDPFSSTDSNTFSIGSLNYELLARAVDEHSRADGTPPSVDIVGNYAPTLDSVVVEDHLGNRLDLSIVDTITWNFWKGIGYPYVCECDTVDKPEAFCYGPNDPPECQFKPFPDHRGTFDFFKSFAFYVKAWGRDHPKDPPPSASDPYGSGVKSWNYSVMNEQGQFINLGKSMMGWFEQEDGMGGLVLNTLNDEVRWKVYYPGPFSPNPDPMGDTVFDNLPGWLGQNLTFILKGRDTRAQSTADFEQIIFINGQPQLINSFPDASLGRHTQERIFAFRIELVR
jgi:hypothetical protein